MIKNTLKRLANSFGFQVTKSKDSYFKRLFQQEKFDVVVDVGANAGQFSSFIRSNGYSGHIIAFEPLGNLRSSIEGVGNITVHSVALGSDNSEREIKVFASSDFSSFYDIGQRYKVNHGGAPEVISKEIVPVARLDDFEIKENSILLKLDTQGSEADVLRGAEQTLKRVNVLVLEMPFLQMYQGGCTVSELFEITRAADLFPSRLYPNEITESGAWVDGDVIFIRQVGKSESRS